MTPDKQVRQTRATHVASSAPVEAYAIHLGQTSGPDRARPLFAIAGRPEGATSPDGRVMGSYLHGMFAANGFRAAFLTALGAEGSDLDYRAVVEATLDALADHVEAHVDCNAMLRLAEVGLGTDPSADGTASVTTTA